MKKPPIRATQLIYIQKDRLIFTSNLDEKKIKKIVEEFDPKLYQPSTGYLQDGKVTISDGNHRAKALIERGEDFVPFALLTKEEFDYVKYSARETGIKVFMPDRPLFYPSFYIEVQMGDVTRLTSPIPLYGFPSEEEKQKILDIAIPKLMEDREFARVHALNGITKTTFVALDLKTILNLKNRIPRWQA